MQSQSPEFDKLLTQEWVNRYEDEKLYIFRSKLKFVHQKALQDGPFFVYFNQQLIENKRESQIQDTQDDFQLVQDFDENAFNFTQVEDSEILFYTDLENEETIPKNDRNEKLEQELENDQEYNFEHPMLINAAPICKYHCILPPFMNEQLPQVIGGELVQLVLNIFSLSKNSSLRLGYNSLCGFSTVNHLHFQLLYADQLFPDLKIFPVERFPREKLFSNGLQTKDEESMVFLIFEIFDQYNVGIVLNQLQGYPVRTFVLEPLQKPKNKEELAYSFTSLSFVLQLIIEKMLDLKIPHNILISDWGTSFYIYPRQAQQILIHEHIMKPAWLELSGLAIVRSKDVFNTFTTDQFDQILRDECSIDEQTFQEIATSVQKKLSQRFN